MLSLVPAHWAPGSRLSEWIRVNGTRQISFEFPFAVLAYYLLKLWINRPPPANVKNLNGSFNSYPATGNQNYWLHESLFCHVIVMVFSILAGISSLTRGDELSARKATPVYSSRERCLKCLVVQKLTNQNRDEVEKANQMQQQREFTRAFIAPVLIGQFYNSHY